MQKRWNFTLHSYARAHRTERSHSSFQCAWKESAELGHQMSKKLRFFVLQDHLDQAWAKKSSVIGENVFCSKQWNIHKKCAKSNLIIKGYEQIFDKASNLQNPQSDVFLIIFFFYKTVLIQFEYFFWWQFISAPLCLLSKVWNGEGVSIEFCSIRGEMRRANDILACYSLLISHFRRLW